MNWYEIPMNSSSILYYVTWVLYGYLMTAFYVDSNGIDRGFTAYKKLLRV